VFETAAFVIVCTNASVRGKKPKSGTNEAGFRCSAVSMEKEPGASDTAWFRSASAFTLQNLRYALAAAEHGSFRQAAEVLLLQQSTLSRCVRQLEDAIGMAIFERSSGGVRATDAGRQFLRSARSILEQVEALATTARSAGRGEAGTLAIGFYMSLASGNLRATLMDVARRFPQLEFQMFEYSRARLETALRNGQVDIAIIPGATALPGAKTTPLWSERIVAALPEGHPLAPRAWLQWIDLKDERILLSRRDPGPELRDLVIAKTTSPGFRPKIVRHDVTRASIKSLVGAGFGVTLLTEASDGASVAGVVYRELRDGVEPARIGYSAQWRADNENPALANFLKILGERYLLLASEP
jgi:DNA-binding transcriptional LysR family regulator